MKFGLIALIATASANATTGDYQQCTSDIVCEEGSLCCDATQSQKASVKICAPWVSCKSKNSKGMWSNNSGCKDTSQYIVNEGLGTYSGYLINYTAVTVEKNASALVASSNAVASALIAM